MSDAKSNGSTPPGEREDTLTKSEGRVAMVQLARAVGVEQPTTEQTMVELAVAIGAEFEQLNQRVAELEQQVGAISDLGREKTTKEEKIAAIVQFAMNKATRDDERVSVRPADIKGVAGCTERYAYNLVDELPGAHPFFLAKDDVSQYGDLEIDKSSQRKALIVDLELLHEDASALNKFNNETTEQGGR
jgi:hypothetical protein